jgi:hypothetical protein
MLGVLRDFGAGRLANIQRRCCIGGHDLASFGFSTATSASSRPERFAKDLNYHDGFVPAISPIPFLPHFPKWGGRSARLALFDLRQLCREGGGVGDYHDLEKRPDLLDKFGFVYVIQ